MDEDGNPLESVSMTVEEGTLVAITVDGVEFSAFENEDEPEDPEDPELPPVDSSSMVGKYNGYNSYFNSSATLSIYETKIVATDNNKSYYYDYSFVNGEIVFYKDGTQVEQKLIYINGIATYLSDIALVLDDK